MRILEITSGLDGGGVDKLLYEYCLRIVPSIQIDFIVVADNEGILEKDLINAGCNIFHVGRITGNIRKHIREINTIISNGSYDIVHDHSGYKAFIHLCIAKKCGVRGRIAHSHIAFLPESILLRVFRGICTRITKFFATDLFACGRDAAEWMWGGHDIFIVPNAIDVDCFRFSPIKRDELRGKYGLENKTILCNVARLSKQKNHEYLLKVFREYHKYDSESILVLIGRGELKKTVVDLINQYRLCDSVILLGIRDDVADLLNMMDVFLLPSLFEGLPLTMVEAQANGLPIIASDTITRETQIIENVSYLPIDNKAIRKWVMQIERYKDKRITKGIENTKFDINIAVDELKQRYIQIFNRNNRNHIG